jgi:RNA polymerase sigma-70 factor (ECF subfamily)
VARSDSELVAAAQQGDTAALDLLLRTHFDRVFAVCRRITGNAHDAADASQNALIAIVRALPNFDGRSSFATWAYRIASNASLDELRRRGRRPLLAVGDDDDTLEPVDTSSWRFDEQLVDRDAIEAAIRDLPDDFRIPLVLRDIVDLEYAEIADQLGIPLGTVKSRIARGRAALMSKLSGNQTTEPQRPTEAP